MTAAASLGIRSAGPDWALRRDFARVLALAVVLPALALAAFLGWSDANARRIAASENLRAVAQWTGRDLDDFLATHRAAVQVLADRHGGERSLDAASWRTDFRRLRAHYPALSSVLVADARGAVVAADPSPSGEDRHRIDDYAFFADVRRTGQAQVSDVFRGRGLHQGPMVVIAAPLQADGRFAGVTASAVDVDAFIAPRGEFLRERGFEVLLLDRSSQVVYATSGTSHAPLDALAGTPLARRLARLPDGSGDMSTLSSALRDGGEAYAEVAPLQDGWRLVVVLPKATLDAQLLRSLATMLGLIAIVAAAVLAIAWWQMRRLAVSVQRLLDRMHRLALDHASTPIAPDSMPQELAPLAEAMNQLSERLGEAYRAANDSLEEQRRLRESLEDVVGAREREIAQRTQELRTAVSELDRLSRTDALTGCLNYRGFREVAVSLWEDARATGKPLSALALDIDYFKAYNDRYGHPRGDAALKRFAGAVRSALYHPEDVVVRPGGEEFIVFLPDTTLEQAYGVAERIVASVRHADIAHAGSPLGLLTVSVGGAVIQAGDGDDPEVMLGRADAALYRAKAAGRNRVSL